VIDVDDCHATSDLPGVDSETPRESQTLRLPPGRLDPLASWADGTALAAAARVREPRGERERERIALVCNEWSDGWLPPGGAVDPGETCRAAARREVREETGLDATVQCPLVVLQQSYVDATTDEERFTARYVVYDATATGSIPPADDLGVHATEIEAARWFETPPENLHDGELLRPYLDVRRRSERDTF
jgi:8-oxo-dGTP pyrophosphatase MutT (NUDIX family)